MAYLDLALPKVGEALLSYGLRALAAFVVLAVGGKSAAYFLRKFSRTRRFRRLPVNARALVSVLTKIGLYAVLAVVVAAILGIGAASIAAAIASAGLAIGLALQGSLANFAGGVMILIFHPFSIGDYIAFDATEGTVEEIGLFYTTLKTPDARAVTIPNGLLSSAVVTDESAYPERRLELRIPAPLDVSLDEARKALLALAGEEKRILSDPAPEVFLGNREEAYYLLRFRVWTKNENYWDLYFSLPEAVRDALAAVGIFSPLPVLALSHDQKGGPLNV